jgi:hypothetical protein
MEPTTLHLADPGRVIIAVREFLQQMAAGPGPQERMRLRRVTP